MKKRFIIMIMCAILFGCDQSEWLDVKSNKNDVVPSSLVDYQAILDNDGELNRYGPWLGTAASDNYYVTDAVFQSSTTPQNANAYIWAKDIDEGRMGYEWTQQYKRIGIANTVIDGIQQFSGQLGYENLRGSALFFRAFAFFNLAQTFANSYEEITANTDLGIVLKLTAQVDEPVKRSTLKETYDQIIKDLLEAENLLPVTPQFRTRPSKPAVLALLGKTYFSMEKYDKALEYSLKALDYQDDILDFNTLNTTAALPFPTIQAGNSEMIFFDMANGFFLGNSRMMIFDSFVDSYDATDLRKKLFFNAAAPTAIRFKGYYTGSNGQHFAGLATNEVYMTVAECYARINGNKDKAIQTLNKLLEKRYETNKYVPIINSISDEDLLRKILTERNKELPYTNLVRWIDLRRLNKDPRFAVTLTRTVLGNTYTLPPNDKRYVFPLPHDEITINGLQQNER